MKRGRGEKGRAKAVINSISAGMAVLKITSGLLRRKGPKAIRLAALLSPASSAPLCQGPPLVLQGGGHLTSAKRSSCGGPN